MKFPEDRQSINFLVIHLIINYLLNRVPGPPPAPAFCDAFNQAETEQKIPKTQSVP